MAQPIGDRFILGGRGRNLWPDVKTHAGLRPMYARRLGWGRGPSGELSCDSYACMYLCPVRASRHSTHVPVCCLFLSGTQDKNIMIIRRMEARQEDEEKEEDMDSLSKRIGGGGESRC